MWRSRIKEFNLLCLLTHAGKQGQYEEDIFLESRNQCKCSGENVKMLMQLS